MPLHVSPGASSLSRGQRGAQQLDALPKKAGVADAHGSCSSGLKCLPSKTTYTVSRHQGQSPAHSPGRVKEGSCHLHHGSHARIFFGKISMRWMILLREARNSLRCDMAIVGPLTLCVAQTNRIRSLVTVIPASLALYNITDTACAVLRRAVGATNITPCPQDWHGPENPNSSPRIGHEEN